MSYGIILIALALAFMISAPLCATMEAVASQVVEEVILRSVLDINPLAKSASALWKTTAYEWMLFNFMNTMKALAQVLMQLGMLLGGIGGVLVINSMGIKIRNSHQS